MARGLLVSYAGYPYALSSLFPDNGLASLAAVLRSEGHECQVLDFNTPENMDRLVDEADRERLRQIESSMEAAPDSGLLQELSRISARIDATSGRRADEVGADLVQRCRREQVDFVGFKLWSGDGFDATLRIVSQLRASCPDLRVFGGGPAVHYSEHVAAAEAAGFDVMIDGDGEAAIGELARLAEGRLGLDGIPNRVTSRAEPRQNTCTQLSELPPPLYDRTAYPAVWDDSKIRMFCLDESRGCPMQCAFCINWHIEGSRWRTRTVDQVVAEIRDLRVRHGGSCCFRFAGTYSPPGFLEKICTALVSEQVPVQFGVSLHPSVVTPKLCGLLREAGCFGVFMGLESGSDRILREAIGKSVRVARCREALEAVMRTGLFAVGSFIFPAPFETEESEAETRSLILECFGNRPNSAINIAFPGLLPRTTWWRERQRYGFELTVEDDTYRRILLHYKIRHLIPAWLWPELPYRLAGQPQRELARRASELQRWSSSQGIAHNMPDHDAQLGAMLGRSPLAFKAELRRIFLTADAEGLSAMVTALNSRMASTPRDG